MLWNWYTIDACFLSSDWQIHSNGAFAATCIGVMLMVVLLEGLRRAGKEYDTLIMHRFNAQLAVLQADAEAHGGDGRKVVFRASPLQQVIRSLIHAATFGLAYIIMLLAMYYNGYLIICIFIGAGLGKFLCDWMTATMVVGGGAAEAKAAGPCDDPTVCCG